MAYCTTQILQLAESIYQGLGSPPAQSVGYVSGWLTSSGNLGMLNNQLSICAYLEGSGPCIANVGADEAAIYQQSYSVGYYEGQARAALAGGGGFVTSMAEGDTKITRSNMVDVAKAFMGLHENAQKALYVAIAQYKRSHTPVANIEGSSLYSWPTP